MIQGEQYLEIIWGDQEQQIWDHGASQWYCGCAYQQSTKWKQDSRTGYCQWWDKRKRTTVLSKQRNAHAMLFRMGNITVVACMSISKQDDDTQYKVSLHYTDALAKLLVLNDTDYPYEFTVEITKDQPVQFCLSLTTVGGNKRKVKL